MRQHLLLFAGAVLGSATLIALPLARAADEPAHRDAVQPAAAQSSPLPDGVERIEVKNPDHVFKAITDVTHAAFSKNIYADVCDRLVDADRDRMKDWNHKDKNQDLADRANALDKKWREKYGDVKLDTDKLFGQNGWVALYEGKIRDPDKLIGHWPLQPVANTTDNARAASERQPGAAPANTAQQQQDAHKFAGGKTNLDKGRAIAVAMYPASHGAPALTLSMIKEVSVDAWRFDIPDNMDGQRLHDNLMRHLEMLDDAAKWPADVNDGYRMVAHHVLMAIYDVNETASQSQAH